MSTDPSIRRHRRARLWTLLMTGVAIAALREAAFARNRTAVAPVTHAPSDDATDDSTTAG